MTDREFVGDVYSSGQPFSRPGPAPGDDHTGPAPTDAPEFEPEFTAEPEFRAEVEPSAPQVSPGILMSFLTDFRSAEYELIRMKRAAELEQSRRKTRTQPAPQVQEEPVPQPDYSGVNYAGAEGSAPPEAAWYPPPVSPAQAAPPEGQVSAAPATNHHPVSGSDFLSAASEGQDPGGKRRTRLGLPSFRNLGQSPATA
ncbi:MAG TPA: hypothetical protein VMO88_08815 [Acidimicrobiales bacterium]|nr:hypothetical protein [Acidimicrobiales bacterium]